MFDLAYGLRCDSSSDPLLIRMDKLMAAIIEGAMPTKFLVVSLVSAYAPDKCSNTKFIRMYFQF
jgi:hypothetical protein